MPDLEVSFCPQGLGVLAAVGGLIKASFSRSGETGTRRVSVSTAAMCTGNRLIYWRPFYPRQSCCARHVDATCIDCEGNPFYAVLRENIAALRESQPCPPHLSGRVWAPCAACPFGAHRPHSEYGPPSARRPRVNNYNA